MYRAPLSILKQELDEKQKIIDSKPSTIKTFVPKVTATIPKNDYNNRFVEENDEYAKNGESNGILPPKPLPRSSRTNSVCETNEDVNNVQKPVARPRTNSCAPVVTSVNPNMPVAGGYKVHLLVASLRNFFFVFLHCFVAITIVVFFFE